VLGGGSAGQAFIGALRRLDEDVEITLVERELVGGECSYWACMPSKALLRPPEVLAAVRLAPGAAEAVTGELDLERVFWHRDQAVDEWDDSRQGAWLAERNIELVRETGRVTERGVVEAGSTSSAMSGL
jgi:pyruvate/2-oxoglutarate dehydrogenase complex dihydrolipoamide dehydrogenase (E3) component